MPQQFLLIDDDAGDRKLIRRLLAQRGEPSEVAEVCDGETALQREGAEPDMIFLDHLMPGANGVDLIGQLSRRWPRAAICMMTGQGDEEIAKQSIQRGAVDYLPKRNLSLEALNRVIKTGCDMARMRWQLAEKREDLSMFSEVLVHDLKAPIRSMRFLVDKLQEDLAAGTATEVSRDIQLIGKSADRLQGLVNSLAGHIHYDHETQEEVAAAADLVEEASQMLLVEIERTGARITVEAEGEISCHAPQIVQLLQNLIGNAIKYSGQTVPQVLIRCSDTPDGLHFEIEDKGIGVPPEYRETIFKPFKRLPVAASIPGTGLGLATCRKIVDRHGGRIWCDPDVEEGTRIHVVLPHRSRGDLARTG